MKEPEEYLDHIRIEILEQQVDKQQKQLESQAEFFKALAKALEIILKTL